MLGILMTSLLPGSGSSSWSYWPFLANTLHIPMYGLLTWLLLKARISNFLWPMVTPKKFSQPAQEQGLRPDTILLTAFMISVTFGVLNEFIQAAVPGRDYSYADMLRNALGAGLAIGIWARTLKP